MYQALTDANVNVIGQTQVPNCRNATFEDWLASMHTLDAEVITGTRAQLTQGLRGKWSDIKIGSTQFKVGDFVILKKRGAIKAPTLAKIMHFEERQTDSGQVFVVCQREPATYHSGQAPIRCVAVQHLQSKLTEAEVKAETAKMKQDRVCRATLHSDKLSGSPQRYAELTVHPGDIPAGGDFPSIGVRLINGKQKTISDHNKTPLWVKQTLIKGGSADGGQSWIIDQNPCPKYKVEQPGFGAPKVEAVFFFKKIGKAVLKEIGQYEMLFEVFEKDGTEAVYSHPPLRFRVMPAEPTRFQVRNLPKTCSAGEGVQFWVDIFDKFDNALIDRDAVKGLMVRVSLEPAVPRDRTTEYFLADPEESVRPKQKLLHDWTPCTAALAVGQGGGLCIASSIIFRSASEGRGRELSVWAQHAGTEEGSTSSTTEPAEDEVCFKMEARFVDARGETKLLEAKGSGKRRSSSASSSAVHPKIKITPGVPTSVVLRDFPSEPVIEGELISGTAYVYDRFGSLTPCTSTKFKAQLVLDGLVCSSVVKIVNGIAEFSEVDVHDEDATEEANLQLRCQILDLESNGECECESDSVTVVSKPSDAGVAGFVLFHDGVQQLDDDDEIDEADMRQISLKFVDKEDNFIDYDSRWLQPKKLVKKKLGVMVNRAACKLKPHGRDSLVLETPQGGWRTGDNSIRCIFNWSVDADRTTQRFVLRRTRAVSTRIVYVPRDSAQFKVLEDDVAEDAHDGRFGVEFLDSEGAAVDFEEKWVEKRGTRPQGVKLNKKWEEAAPTDGSKVLQFKRTDWRPGKYTLAFNFNGASFEPIVFNISETVRALDVRLVRVGGGTLDDLEEGSPMKLGLQFLERGAGSDSIVDYDPSWMPRAKRKGTTGRRGVTITDGNLTVTRDDVDSTLEGGVLLLSPLRPHSGWQSGTYTVTCSFDRIDFDGKQCPFVVKAPLPSSFEVCHLTKARAPKLLKLADGAELRRDQIGKIFLRFKHLDGKDVPFRPEWIAGRSKSIGVELGRPHSGLGRLAAECLVPSKGGATGGLLELRPDAWPVCDAMAIKCKFKGVTFETEKVLLGITEAEVMPAPKQPDPEHVMVPWDLLCSIVDDYQTGGGGAGAAAPMRNPEMMLAFLRQRAGRSVAAGSGAGAAGEDRSEDTEDYGSQEES